MNTEMRAYIDGLPTEYDVVAGRGGASNNHPGNVWYWEIILENRGRYQQSRSSLEKAALAHEIFDSINEIGRFLKKEKKTGLWFEQPEEDAINKIKQALRDKYVPRWARPLFFEGMRFYPIDNEPENFE